MNHAHPQFGAVLYDLDGTLLDTIADIASAMNAALRSHGFPQHPAEAYRSMVGWGLAQLVRKALPPDRSDDALVRECLKAMKDRYARYPVVDTKPYPGIVDLLNEVAGRGYPQAIFSNKADELTQVIVERTLPRNRLQFVRGALPGVPHKPDPSGAFEVCSSLSIGPGAFVYVGDSQVDMETARAAGMYPVGVSWGFRDVDELAAAGAKMILRSPGELLELLLPANGAPGGVASRTV